MTTKQIRFTVSDEMVGALEEVRQKLKFLSDAEIFKIAFSKFYREEIGLDENGFTPTEQRELDATIADVDAGINLEGPFNSMQEFIDSMKK